MFLGLSTLQDHNPFFPPPSARTVRQKRLNTRLQRPQHAYLLLKANPSRQYEVLFTTAGWSEVWDPFNWPSISLLVRSGWCNTEDKQNGQSHDRTSRAPTKKKEKTPPQHGRRTKAVIHRHNLFRLIWSDFEIDFDFNFVHEQIRLPPPLAASVSLVLCDFLFSYHTRAHTHMHASTQSTFAQETSTVHTDAHRSPLSLWHFKRGPRFCQFLCFKVMSSNGWKSRWKRWSSFKTATDNKQTCLSI